MKRWNLETVYSDKRLWERVMGELKENGAVEIWEIGTVTKTLGIAASFNILHQRPGMERNQGTLR